MRTCKLILREAFWVTAATILLIGMTGCGTHRQKFISCQAIQQPDGKTLVKYIRVYADASGVSHFGDAVAELKSLPFAPPAPPLDVSNPASANQFLFLHTRPGWYGDWHPVPRRQIMILVAGECEVGVSDGEIRRVGPGSVALVEDTIGKGHTTRVIGNEDVLFAVVQLSE